MPSINGTPSVSDINSIQTKAESVMNGLQGIPGTQGIVQYFAQQNQAVQQMQQKQASDLIQYSTYDKLMGGQMQEPLTKALAQNPYGQQFLRRQQMSGGMSGAMQPQSGDQGMSMAVGGGSPAISGGQPTMTGAVGGMQPSGVAGQVPSGPVVTGGTQSFETPFGKRSTTYANPQAEAVVSGAKASGSEMGGSVTKSQIGTIRDDNQLRMVAQSLSNLNKLHNDLSQSKVLGGLNAAGDEYGSHIAENAGFIPQFGGLQGKAVSPDIQNKVGQFVSGRNELIMKTMPMETQQFGQNGSVRIMDGVLKMMGGEIGDLQTPRAQFEGQMQGTLGTLYRIQQASKQYQADLEKMGQPMPNNPDLVTKEIYKRLPQLSEQQNNELNDLVSSSLGKEQKQSFSPMNKFQQQSQPVQQGQQSQQSNQNKDYSNLWSK